MANLDALDVKSAGEIQRVAHEYGDPATKS
ncbi:MAG: hypothetical protein BMS9Abin05_1811 [Rhodothermia bacterium]|nr:MAG: hypothetical protein BMS9Abin05_1811 [Rhodothermia bacterium]